MPITAEQLGGIADGFHAEAEKHFAANGRVVPALWLIPPTGAARLVPMPEGVLNHGQIAQLAQADRPEAILFTGEFWVGSVTIPASTAARLPMDDLPLPSEQTDRREAIVTRAVGRASDGTVLHIQRANLILRTVFGPAQLHAFPIDPAAGRDDDFAAFLASLLADPEGNRRTRRR